MSDKEQLEKLKKEAVELQNTKVDLIGQYNEALNEGNLTLANEIENEWANLQHQIKTINKRIELLKNQGDF